MNKRTKQIWRWFGWLVLLGVLSLSSINCGFLRPPRLWSCECERVCLQQGGAREKVTQRACGYNPRQAARYAQSVCSRTPLPGCQKTACVCNKCLVSRRRYCRSRRNPITTPGGGWDDDVTDWEPAGPSYDDDDVIYEESEEFVPYTGQDNWNNNPGDDDPYDWGDDNWSDDDPGDNNWSDDEWSDDEWSDDDWGDDDWGDDDWGDDDD